jgi:hypothetical protein
VLDDLAWALDSRRFGLRSLGTIFSEPVPRTSERYADLALELGDNAVHLPAVYAALAVPEPGPDDHPRIDEADAVRDFVRLWSLVDPSGSAHVRVARQIGDATRRIAEGWLDVWDEVAQPVPRPRAPRPSARRPTRRTRPTRSRTRRSGCRSWRAASSRSSTNGRSRRR